MGGTRTLAANCLEANEEENRVRYTVKNIHLIKSREFLREDHAFLTVKPEKKDFLWEEILM